MNKYLHRSFLIFIMAVLFVFICGIGSCKKSISGKVKGDAREGVILTLSGDTSASIITDVNGNYKFKNLEAGSYTITPIKSGYGFFPKNQKVTVDADKTGVDFGAGAGMDAVSGASIQPF